MEVHYSADGLPPFRNAVLTIGTFDGVHSGHQQIIRQLRQEANAVGGETVLITFDPHPRKVVGAGPLPLLNTLPEKQQLLAQLGVDHLVVVPFTESFAAQPARDYVESFLLGRFHPNTIIIGYDHRFGQDRQGNFQLLEQYAADGRFRLIEIPGHLLQSIAVSSTRIRKALLEGDIASANEGLGYHYFFEGVVVEGNKLGRTIGYPTANLQIQDADKLVPANAVYAVRAQVNGQTLNGMMNIGVRPTVDGTRRVIEVNLFNFDSDIYGSTLRVELISKLRDEKKFNGLEELKQQLANDQLRALDELRD